MKKLVMLVVVVASASLCSFTLCPTSEEMAVSKYIEAKRTGEDVKIKLSQRRDNYDYYAPAGYSDYELGSDYYQ